MSHLLFEAGALECDIFASLDVPGADARPAAESPVESDLRGVESHSVIRLTVYAYRLQAKATNPRPRIRAVARDLCNALKAPAELGSRRVKQTSMLQSSAMTPSR